MSKILSINNFNEIDNIIDIVHDCWFDVEEIFFSKKESLIQFHFYKKKCSFLFSNKLIKKGTININDVASYNITETENIGIYDINTISFDEEKNIITILTGIPLHFSIKIYSFSISIEMNE